MDIWLSMFISTSAGSGDANEAGELPLLESVSSIVSNRAGGCVGSEMPWSSLKGSVWALFIDGRTSAFSRSHGGSCKPAALRCFYCKHPSV